MWRWKGLKLCAYRRDLKERQTALRAQLTPFPLREASVVSTVCVMRATREVTVESAPRASRASTSISMGRVHASLVRPGFIAV